MNREASPRGLFALLSVLLCLSPTLVASEFRSVYRLRATPPAGWVVLTKQKLEQNPRLVEQTFTAANQSQQNRMRSGILASQFEVIAPAPSKNSSGENVVIRQQTGVFPRSSSDLVKSCEAARATFQRNSSQPVKVHACRFEALPAGKAAFAEFDSGTPGMRLVEYMLRRSDGVFMTFTGTFSETSLGPKRALLTEFAKSVRFEP